jgi:hypothetical protein
MTIGVQLIWLFVLPLPIACLAWTVTQEEIFKEPRQYCITQAQQGRRVLQRKFFYLFTCEYCFSHYVALFFLVLTDFKLFLFDWRGYLIAWFALVWLANIYMSLFGLLRQDIKKEKASISLLQPQEQNKSDLKKI